ncbi:MAG: AAA family ATPase [Bdellovibrionaceae bacterium]|nr:AAA family ATPase [Pseudobdellovibrionaceae bacterium]
MSIDHFEFISLAEKLRPQCLMDIVGQQPALDPAKSLLSQVQAGQLVSLILWGPPGSGKTSAAMCLASSVGAHFETNQAMDLNASKIREIIEQAINRRANGQRTLLFVDEIHRLTKIQQDAFLSALEKGYLYLLGATTENPHYELTRALLSRCHVIRFEALEKKDLLSIYQRALDKLEIQSPFLEVTTLEFVIESSQGDCRRFLNLIESCYRQFLIKRSPIQIEDINRILSHQHLTKNVDKSYRSDLISAFIKSIRGSDPDAALLYLAQALEIGEDPVYLARRLVVLASEDVGNADPRGLTLAVSGFQACEFLGMPEARIPLAQVTIYLASAPKSDSSYLAINKAIDYVSRQPLVEIPQILKVSQKGLPLSTPTKYETPQRAPRGWNGQSYRSNQDQEAKFFVPQERGFEKTMSDYLRWIRGEPK